MFSGGLDSILAVKIMIEEGFDVIPLHFYNGFNDKIQREIAEGGLWKWTPRDSVLESAEKLGVELVTFDMAEAFLDTLKHPKHGYGTALNPCIDCRIMFLRKAAQIMKQEEAILVFTGEVMGQRPMSQHKPTLKCVLRESGLEGRLLRPLSAKLLEPTIPEIEGIVNRGHLYDFSGRSRKPQQALAAKYGIDYYPESGGGCILTEKSYLRRYQDLAGHIGEDAVTLKDLKTFKTGRHMRLPGGTKIVVGRSEVENRYFGELLGDDIWTFTVKDIKSTWIFAFGDPPEQDVRLIAEICARYSKAGPDDTVTVIGKKGNEFREVRVKPARDETIAPLMIHDADEAVTGVVSQK